MRKCLSLITLSVLAGCGEAVFGGGDLFVWNGTPTKVTITVDGRTSDEFAVLSGTGRHVRAVAGAYKVKVAPEGGSEELVELEVAPDTMELVNVGAADCFARIDVTGEYQPSKPRALVIESYPAKARISVPTTVHVMPGESLPSSRPKNVAKFQRLMVVDCKIVGDQYAIVEAAQKRR